MLTVSETATRTGVSPGTVYRWVTEARLPHFRLGAAGKRGKIGIDPADLEAFLAGVRVGPAAVPPPSQRPAEPRAAFKHVRVR